MAALSVPQISFDFDRNAFPIRLRVGAFVSRLVGLLSYLCPRQVAEGNHLRLWKYLGKYKEIRHLDYLIPISLIATKSDTVRV